MPVTGVKTDEYVSVIYSFPLAVRDGTNNAPKCFRYVKE